MSEEYGVPVLDFDEHRGWHLVYQIDDEDYAQLHELIHKIVHGGCSSASVGYEGCSCPRCALDRLASRAAAARTRAAHEYHRRMAGAFAEWWKERAARVEDREVRDMLLSCAAEMRAVSIGQIPRRVTDEVGHPRERA